MQRVITKTLIYFSYAPLILVNSTFCNNNNNNNFISRGLHIWHSNIWSSDTKTYMHLIITKQWKLFTVCTEQVRSPYIEHAASGLPNLTCLEGGYTIYPDSRPAGITTCSPRMLTECFLTRWMLIKMYKYTISWYVPVYVHYIYSQ